jgi:hypothetical protein
MLKRIDVNNFQHKIEWLWERVRGEEYFFDDLTKGNHQLFLVSLFRLDSEHYYNESGMVSAVDIQHFMNANIHFLVWDRAYPPAKILAEARVLFRDLFERHSLNRLTATIPSTNKAAIRLASMLGMKFEGTMRECFLHGGQLYDLHIYGVLKREFKHSQKEVGWADSQALQPS